MPLTIGATTAPDDYFVVGRNDDGSPGAQLQPGQTATVTRADPATVVVTPDGTARVTSADFAFADGTAVPAGTQSIASGKVSAATSPAQPGVAIVVTSHLANADGTPVMDDETPPVAVPDVTDTVTVQVSPKLLRSEGILFGVPAASAKRTMR
jgi:hypothetical protein